MGQVASTDTTVLILGETGTGKEVAARAIHDLSARADRTMIKVNCAALPAGIVESELFGRAKGAYTGAPTDQPGRFEIADGSTLFLDEIGELSQELQAKLLCVLQDGKFERLGSTKTISVDVRVIAATNRNLEEMVRRGHFQAGPLLPAQCFPNLYPAVARARRGNSLPDRGVHQGVCAQDGQADQVHRTPHHPGNAPISMARKYKGTEKHGGKGHDRKRRPDPRITVAQRVPICCS